jgi:hypothetical protein
LMLYLNDSNNNKHNKRILFDGINQFSPSWAAAGD